MRDAFNQEIDLSALPRTGRNQHGQAILNFRSQEAEIEMLAAKLANETRSERIYREKQRAKRGGRR